MNKDEWIIFGVILSFACGCVTLLSALYDVDPGRYYWLWSDSWFGLLRDLHDEYNNCWTLLFRMFGIFVLRLPVFKVLAVGEVGEFFAVNQAFILNGNNAHCIALCARACAPGGSNSVLAHVGCLVGYRRNDFSIIFTWGLECYLIKIRVLVGKNNLINLLGVEFA